MVERGVERPSEVTPDQSWFDRAAEWCSTVLGKSLSFIIAICVIVGWASTGPIFGFNDTWQLIINTSTTIMTFLFLFLLQNSTNRQGNAEQKKLNAIADGLAELMIHQGVEGVEVDELRASVGLEQRESS